MLKDYIEYIENIRNNLIQNDIEVPVSELDEYSDLFQFTLILEQVCWFYQKLLQINSDYAVKSPYLYSEDYVEKIRQLSYREFISSLEGYKNISARYCRLRVLKERVSNLQEKLDELKGNIDSSIDMDEEIDLFGETNKSNSSESEDFSPQTFLNIVQRSSNSSESVVNFNQFDGNVVHGIFIDEYCVESDSNNEVTEGKEGTSFIKGHKSIFPDDLEVFKKEENDEVVTQENADIVHGIYIDEWTSYEKVNTENNDNVDDVVIHGIYIDEWVVNADNDSRGISDEDKGNVHGIYIDEWEGSENVDDSIEEIHGTFIDEWQPSKSYSSMDEEGLSKPEYSEWDDILEDEEEDEIVSNEDFEPHLEIRVSTKTGNESSPKNTTKDISDNIQDITNQVLTEGKRFLAKGLSRLNSSS